jgi:hypothetical protein
MNAAQIKDGFRELNRTDKIEIYRWLDREKQQRVSIVGSEYIGHLRSARKSNGSARAPTRKGVYTSARQRKILSVITSGERGLWECSPTESTIVIR